MPRPKYLQPPWTLLALLALPLAAYGPYLSTGFASEDFLILGRFHRGPLAPLLWEQFQSPWLGLSYVSFYRPVGTLLLGLEYFVFGLKPLLFHLSHVTLHGINTVLVYQILRRFWSSSRIWPAFAAASLFGIYPLHHGAVLFIGGFGTLFGSFFLLLSLSLYMGPDSTSRKAASLAAFAAALGSYEAAVVLPPVLISLELIMGGGYRRGMNLDHKATALPPSSAENLRQRCRTALARAAKRIAPYWVILGAYFLVRRAVLGVFVGGYSSFQERPLTRLWQMGEDFLLSLPRLVFPNFHWLPANQTLLIVAITGLVGGTAICALQRRRHEGTDSGTSDVSALRRWLLALAWIAVFQLPFFFVGTIPATGRFWYLASMASCLGWITVATCIAGEDGGRWTVHRRAVATLMIFATALVFWRLLDKDLRLFRIADEQVHAVQERVTKMAAQLPAAKVLFVTGVPDFVPNDRGLAVAKVLQYGLVEAVNPPFAEALSFKASSATTLSTEASSARTPSTEASLESSLSAAVDAGPRNAIPLPPSVAEDRFGPLAKTSGGQVLRWLPKAQELRLMEPHEAQAPRHIKASLESDETLRHGCQQCQALRLFVVTPGGTFSGEASPQEIAAGTMRLPMPFLTSMATLYENGPAKPVAYWWLESRDPGRRLIAASKVLQIPLPRFQAPRFRAPRFRAGASP